MGVRVLLVDDQEEARSSLAQRLRRSKGIELVGAVADAPAASLIAKQQDPDVLLVDVHHRDGAELELCESLHRANAAPLVALVSYITPERWRQLSKVGVVDFVLKHVDTAMLERDLTRLVERRRGASGSG